MPLLLSPEQELVKQVVREFAEKELGPEATPVDRSARFPRDHANRMAPLGLLGMLVPAEAGGAGTDTLSFVVAVEEVARVSGTDAAFMILQNTVVNLLLARQGSEAQRADLLAPALAGARIGATAITEEAGGSSAEDLLTSATQAEGGGYLLKGSKAFVALAGVADHYLILANLVGAGRTLFAAPAGSPGLHFSEPESKLGLRGLPLAEMYLNRMPLPPSSLLGAAGQGSKALEEPTALARVGVAAALVGLTQSALEQSIEFARGRVQFGQPIVTFGAIRGFLADVQAELEAARATTYGAAALRDSGKDYTEEVYEARLLAHRIAVKGTRLAHKIHGGAGFMRDLPLERVSRDVRTLMHMWDAQDVTRARLATRLLG